MTQTSEALGIGINVDSTQPFTEEQLAEVRRLARAAGLRRPATVVDIEFFAHFGDAGTPPGMIVSGNVDSRMVSGSCGDVEDVPVARRELPSSRPPSSSGPVVERGRPPSRPAAPAPEDPQRGRSGASEAARPRRATREPGPATPIDTDAEFEERRTREMPAVPDDDDERSAEFDSRATRPVAIVREADAPATPPAAPGLAMSASVAPSPVSAQPVDAPAAGEPRRARDRVWLIAALIVAVSSLGAALSIAKRSAGSPVIVALATSEPTPPSEGSATADPSSSPTPAQTETEVLSELPPPEAHEPATTKPKPPPHATKACKQHRDKTETAFTSRKWNLVIRLTNKRTCWPPPRVEADEWRIKSLRQLSRFAECVEMGRRSTQPVIIEVMKSCEVAL